MALTGRIHDQLQAHLQNLVDAYNFARRLKTLRSLTPYATESLNAARKRWQEPGAVAAPSGPKPFCAWRRVCSRRVGEGGPWKMAPSLLVMTRGRKWEVWHAADSMIDSKDGKG
jgi:hypothetical protein